MIVKLQRPYANGCGVLNDEFWLAYPQGRPWMELLPATRVPKAVKAAMGDDYKAYFEADRDGRMITWRDRVAAQSW